MGGGGEISCCGSGSGLIGVFLPDSEQERDRHPGSAHPDPEPYQFFNFKPELKLNSTVPYHVTEKFQYTVRHRTVQKIWKLLLFIITVYYYCLLLLFEIQLRTFSRILIKLFMIVDRIQPRKIECYGFVT